MLYRRLFAKPAEPLQHKLQKPLALRFFMIFLLNFQADVGVLLKKIYLCTCQTKYFDK